MYHQLLLSVLETGRTAESRSHDLTANPVALTQLVNNNVFWALFYWRYNFLKTSRGNDDAEVLAFVRHFCRETKTPP